MERNMCILESTKYGYIFLSSYVDYNNHSLSFREGPVSVKMSIFVLYDKTEITSMNIKMDDGSPRSHHFGNALSLFSHLLAEYQAMVSQHCT